MLLFTCECFSVCSTVCSHVQNVRNHPCVTDNYRTVTELKFMLRSWVEVQNMVTEYSARTPTGP